MTPYCTMAEFTAKYPILNDAQRRCAPAYLEDASVAIRDALNASGRDDMSLNRDTLVKVCRDMAYRALSTLGDSGPGFGVSQYTQSAIGYSETSQFSNATGDFYFTKAERKALGISGTRVAQIRPHMAGGYGD